MLPPLPGSAMLNPKVSPGGRVKINVTHHHRPKHGFGSNGGSMATALLRSLSTSTWLPPGY